MSRAVASRRAARLSGEGDEASRMAGTSLFENAPFGIFQSSVRHLLHANPMLARMFGYASSAEMIARAGEAKTLYVDSKQCEKIVNEAIESGAYVQQEVEYRRRDGSTFTANLRLRAVRGESGKVRFLLGFVEDITERRRLAEQLRQAQRMEAIGQLAGGVAHDFNNILSAILMQLGLLQQSPQLTIGVKEALKEVEGEALRAATLTRQLLLFSRRQVASFEPLDVNALINDLLKLLRRLLGEHIEVDFQGSREAAWVDADAGMLEQLVMNLCLNARDAMPAGGKLTLSTTLVERKAECAKTHPDARPGRFVCLAVRDTGCGMDEAVRKRLFEPFFTTKGLGKGTGLGLATVYGITQQHEGWIEVESAVGKGSAFRVYFPVLQPPLGKAPLTSSREELRGGSETILLVEDDAPVRRVAALCLRKFGYAVLEAANGAEALKLWEQHQQKIALLLTDMVMPETMTGLELAQQLRKDKAALRVIVASGYHANLASPETLDSGVNFLAKPFRPAALAKLVRQCLDKTLVTSTQRGRMV